MPKTGYKIQNRKCCTCGSSDTYFSGKYYWFKYYDEKGNWDFKSYICNDCYKNKGKDINKEIEYYKNKRQHRFDKRKCAKCGIDKTSKWHREFNNDKNWTGKYLCNRCFQKSDLNYHYLIRKSTTRSRIGYIQKDTRQGMAVMSQAVVAKYFDIEDLNIKMDNFKWYIDMENIGAIYGKIDVKSSKLSRDGQWTFQTERKIDCDTYICTGFGAELKDIESVYIIPNEYVYKLGSVTTIKNPLTQCKYDKFKINNIIWNIIYGDLLLYLKEKEFFGVDDIKEWNKNCNILKKIEKLRNEIYKFIELA